MTEPPTSTRIGTRERRAVAGQLWRVGPRTEDTIPRLPRTPDRPFPLSFAQERMWCLDRLHAGTGVCAVIAARRIHGPVDPAALEEAVNAVVARHEVLRTVFRLVDGEPAQFILPGRRIRVAHERVAEDGSLPAMLDAMARSEIRTGFDLGRDPLLRARLLTLAPEDAVLLVVLHHIVADAWSIEIFERELAAAYDNLRVGRAAALGPELSVQVADAAAEQRRMLRSDEEDRLLSFWRRELDDLEDGSRAHAFGRPYVPSFRGAREHFELPHGTRDAALGLARAERVTLFMILLTAFGLTLSRYTGRRRFVVGTPISERSRETEPLIGCFLNTLPMAVHVEAGRTGRELLRATRRVVLDAMAHARLPFERLASRLSLFRGTGGAPALRFWLALLNTPRSEHSPESFRWEPLWLDPGVCQFEAALIVRQRPRAIDGFLEFDTGMMARETAAGLVADMHHAIAALAERPDATAEQLLRGLASRAGYPRAAAEACTDFTF